MLSFYEEKGSRVIVHDHMNNVTSRVNTDNIDEIFETENKIEYVSSKLGTFRRKLNRLDTSFSIANMINIFSIVLGVSIFCLLYFFKKGDMALIILPISLCTTITPMLFFDTWGKIGEYFKYHHDLKDKVDVLNLVLKRAYRKKMRLEKNKKAIEGNSYQIHDIKDIEPEVRKEIDDTTDVISIRRSGGYAEFDIPKVGGKHFSKTPLVDKYGDSKFVNKFREHGISDEKIERELELLENDILNKPQKVDIYEGLSFEEACEAFEKEVNAIHVECELDALVKRSRR